MKGDGLTNVPALTIAQAAAAEGVALEAMRSRVRRRPDAIVRRSRGRGQTLLIDLSILRAAPDRVSSTNDVSMARYALGLSEKIPALIREAVRRVPIRFATRRELAAIRYAVGAAILDELRRLNPRIAELEDAP